jgi:HSP20 family molecular chaperone IbpA
MNRLWRDLGHRGAEEGNVESWAIPLDVVQQGDNIVVKATVPGVSPEDIDVSIENDVLTIKGHPPLSHQVIAFLMLALFLSMALITRMGF